MENTENNGQLAKKTVMRFAIAKNSDDIEKAKQLGVPIKTEQATSWSVKAWQEWTMQRDKDGLEMHMLLSNNIEEMNNECLNFWMPRFILEIRKKNGDEYPPPNSLYQMVCGLQRQVQKTRPQVIFFSA